MKFEVRYIMTLMLVLFIFNTSCGAGGALVNIAKTSYDAANRYDRQGDQEKSGIFFLIFVVITLFIIGSIVSYISQHPVGCGCSALIAIIAILFLMNQSENSNNNYNNDDKNESVSEDIKNTRETNLIK